VSEKFLFKKNIKHILANKRMTIIGSKLFSKLFFVLMYHDICEDNDFPSWLRVKKSAFESQMSQLQEICTFIRPSELFQENFPGNNHLNILLSFDDGFVNQYRLASPIIKKFSIPALFFISTENTQTGEIFWFDRIITPIQVKRIDQLDLRFLSLDDYQFPLNDEIQRWETIQLLLNDVKEKHKNEKHIFENIMRFFDETYGGEMQEYVKKYRPLKKDEILKMKESGYCYFGSHSHKHEILTCLENEDIRNNLIESKNYLESLLGEPITHISYPNGNVNQNVEMLCREAGYDYGYTTQHCIVKKDTNRMQIPRISVGGYDTIQMLFWKINKAMIKRVIAS
jgi:peptidoglycan/xylan/chitin deacetylase (PgdA/CDA1 family)